MCGQSAVYKSWQPTPVVSARLGGCRMMRRYWRRCLLLIAAIALFFTGQDHLGYALLHLARVLGRSLHHTKRL